MVQAALLMVLGILGSAIAVVVILAGVSHLLHYQNERACMLETYYQWVMQKGNAEQKQMAEIYRRSNQLNALRKLVGSGILVEE
jgi:hypothetical protein